MVFEKVYIALRRSVGRGKRDVGIGILSVGVCDMIESLSGVNQHIPAVAVYILEYTVYALRHSAVFDFEKFVPTVPLLVDSVFIDKVPHIRGSITTNAQRRRGKVYALEVSERESTPIFESDVGVRFHRLYSVCE